ncbi:hypothetical protein CIK05_15575 [Bdellovibrio sp. qaytius]|nr:hypothetical protein CIK05_15575 [Bdellovibrio sp. qaytius]
MAMKNKFTFCVLIFLIETLASFEANACSEANIRKQLYHMSAKNSFQTVIHTMFTIKATTGKTGEQVKQEYIKLVDEFNSRINSENDEISKIAKLDPTCHIGDLTKEFQPK